VSTKKTVAAAATASQNVARAPETLPPRVSAPAAAKSEPPAAAPPQPTTPGVVAPTARSVDTPPRAEPVPLMAPAQKTSPAPEAQPQAEFKAALARKSYAEAFELARPAAEGGDREAQYTMGSLYYNGQGVNASDETAASWFRKAAEQNYVPAQL